MEIAFVLLKCRYDKTIAIEKFLQSEIPYVKEVYPIYGKSDIICKLEVPDLDELSNIILLKLRDLDGLEETETHIVMKI
ncbi:MAG: Lrp/AsnC ligand binding domain-containing protein [Theionarchaea archaeon]|nr:MAG: hypothetical protein AYK18_14065 [Theionarchaea archaeon DG-70]MBU7009404.1 Lrp/AsnC ligand binding domain-containing protein [Theionarchaea archaeon]